MHACRHTTRFILIYTFFMPIVLWRNLEWGVFFVAPLITLLLAGIDNIGMHIENPFRILPMAAYCRVIQENIAIAACDWASENSKVQAPSPDVCCRFSLKAHLYDPEIYSDPKDKTQPTLIGTGMRVGC